jgi:thiamine biosynthesis protein ThiS
MEEGIVMSFEMNESPQVIKHFIMHIKVNGESHEFSAPLTIEALIQQLAIDPKGVAIECNRTIISRSRYMETLVNEGDEIEIVRFIGGG